MSNSLHSSISSSPFKLALISSSIALCSALIFSKMPMQIWTLVVSSLRPPYIYALINSIIVMLIVITKFQQCFVDRRAKGKPTMEPVEIRPEFVYGYHIYQQEKTDVAAEQELESVVALAFTADSSEEMTDGDELMVMSTETLQTPSERIGHLADVKSRVEGTDTMVVAPTKPKQHNILESTSKTLSESQTMPVTRHQEKPYTSETSGRAHDHVQAMKKHATFSNHKTTTSYIGTHSEPRQLMWEDRSLWKLRKEPSLSQDELNSRVEAFIKKFNEDMRLQRQESLDRRLEVIKSVAH